MWDIASTLRRHWLEVAWGAFAAANLAVIAVLLRWETIPFHLIWVSLTLLYGFRVWRPRTTAIVLLVVIVTTGAALTWTVLRGHEQLDEVMEVPLMAAMFLAMAMHAHRRQRAVDSVHRAAASERRVLERQREFVRDASHELRTPITVARGHAELIRVDETNQQTAHDAKVILEELERLSKLSERLLTLANADDPGFLSLEEVPVEELVADTVVRWEAAAPRRWLVHLGVEGVIRVDRSRLETAIDALVENAVHATREGQRIQLSAWSEEGELVLQVADDGVGIGVDDLPHVFERFSRRDRARGRGNGGTGLGLAIVKAVVEAHGGTVCVRSEPGRGASFRILLPSFSGRDEGSGNGGGSAAPRQPDRLPLTPRGARS
jgi:two-component system OmpR family sensor kinase